MSKIHLTSLAVFTLFIGGVACSTKEKEEAQNQEQDSFEQEITVSREETIIEKQLQLNSIILPITEKKLDSIIIPSVEFKNANIHDVLRTLSQYARKNDEKGFNIILRYLTDSRDEKDIKLKVVNANFKNVSLGKILRDMCQTFNVSYEISKHGLNVIETEDSTIIEEK